jgi:hypothetical protein
LIEVFATEMHQVGVYTMRMRMTFGGLPVMFKNNFVLGSEEIIIVNVTQNEGGRIEGHLQNPPPLDRPLPAGPPMSQTV